MKKTIISLSVLALFVGGCKQKTTSENLLTTSTKADTLNIQQELTEIIFHKDTLFVNGFQLIKTSNEDTTQFYCLTTINSDTIIPFADYYHQITFLDINEDGYSDIRVYRFSNTPNDCDNYFFDNQHKTFRLVENCYVDIQKLSGTDFYYSYEAVGCADMNWESLLIKIEDYWSIAYGVISGYGCKEQRFIIVHKFEVDKDTKRLKGKKIFEGEQEILVANQIFIECISYTENLDKWDFIKNYWKTNYRDFE